MKRLIVALLLCLALPAHAATTFGAMARGAATDSTTIQTTLSGLTNGGVLKLGPGTYSGNLTIGNAGTILEGDGVDATILTGQILVTAGDVTIKNLTVRATNQPWGIKLYRGSGLGFGGVPRCTLKNLWVGGTDTTTRNAGTAGPLKGLFLDGAILTRVEQCTFAFCRGPGVYAQATDLPSWTTNQNRFIDCTMNLNGTYGLEFAGTGMEGNQIIGGNMEDNDSIAVYVTGNTNFKLSGVDFEQTARQIMQSNQVEVDATNPAVVEDCNFLSGAGVVTRAFSGSSDNGVEVRRCRFSGFPAKAPLAIFDPVSTNCVYSGNVFADSLNFVLNKGTVPLQGQPWGEPWRSPLATFSGALWLPDSAAASGSGLGPPWVSNGTLARVTPTYGDSGSWMRRTSFASSGASQELGIKMTNAAEFQFFRNSAHNAGGFYFSATFRVETWAGNLARMFVGMASSAAASVVGSVDSSGVGNNVIGLYHDANDVNKFWVIAKGTGAVTKSAFTLPSATNESFPATSKAFRFEMQNFPYSTTVYCLLTRLEDGKVVGFQNVNAGPADAVFLAPQVELNNGTAGACSLGIINVYCTR